MFAQVTNTNTGNTYSTIQAAIDDPATLDGHTLAIAPGVYTENVLVNKELTINGPMMGVDGNDASRGTGEAIIYPPSVHYGDGTFNGGYLMRVTADNVTIDGLTFDGDNPSLEGNYSTSSGAFDIDFGIMSYWSVWYEDYPENPEDYDVTKDPAGDNLSIQNNILKNFKLNAILMQSDYWNPVAKSGEILHNKIQNVASFGAILMYENYYANIEYNTIVDAINGITVYFYWLSKNVSSSGTINNNSITLKTIETNWGETHTNVNGIQMNFVYNGFVDVWNVSNNELNNTTERSAGSIGIFLFRIESQELIVSNNNINNYENGYLVHSSVNVWNLSEILDIEGGEIRNCSYGIVAANSVEFLPLQVTTPYNFAGLTILNSTIAGIYVASENVYLPDENNWTPTDVYLNAVNCKISGSPAGILLSGDYAHANVHNNDLSGNGSYSINNLSVNILDATCNWYGNWTGPTNDGNTGGMGGIVTGNVTFDPWLVDGTDNDGTLAGFQPVFGSCVPIKCGNKNNKYLVCHKGKTLCVGYDDALIHLSHGDYLGECLKLSGDEISLVQVSEESEGLQAMVAPNPSTSNFELWVSSSDDAIIEVKVFDVNGRIICKPVIINDQTTWFGNDFPRGIYMVQVKQGENLKTLKVIKQ